MGLASLDFIYITLRTIFEPFSAHYPSQDHMDDLCSGFLIQQETRLCSCRHDCGFSPRSLSKCISSSLVGFDNDWPYMLVDQEYCDVLSIMCVPVKSLFDC